MSIKSIANSTLLYTQPTSLTFIRKYEFTSVTSFVIDNLFSPDFNSYRLFFNASSTTADGVRFKFRKNGVTTTSSDYRYVEMYGTGTTKGGYTSGDVAFWYSIAYLGATSTGLKNYNKFEIFAPTDANIYKIGHSVNTSATNGNIETNSQGFRKLGTLESYDGIYVEPLYSATGTLYVYGYNSI